MAAFVAKLQARLRSVRARLRSGLVALRRRLDYDGMTVVVAVAVLLLVFGSGGDVALTEAVFVIVPLVGDLTTMVIVAELPLAMLPSAQVTSDLDGLAVQEPAVVDAEANPAFLGSWSFMVTPLAAEGPLVVPT